MAVIVLGAHHSTPTAETAADQSTKTSSAAEQGLGCYFMYDLHIPLWCFPFEFPGCICQLLHLRISDFRSLTISYGAHLRYFFANLHLYLFFSCIVYVWYLFIMQLLLQTRLQIPTPYMFLSLLTYLGPKVSEHVLFDNMWFLLLCFLLLFCVSYRGSATTR